MPSTLWMGKGAVPLSSKVAASRTSRKVNASFDAVASGKRADNSRESAPSLAHVQCCQLEEFPFAKRMRRTRSSSSASLSSPLSKAATSCFEALGTSMANSRMSLPALNASISNWPTGANSLTPFIFKASVSTKPS